MKEIKLSFLPRLALILFSLISLVYIAILGQSLLAPMLFSMLMAFLLLPLATYLENKVKFKRTVAAITSVIIMIAVISSVLYFFAYQLSELWNDWPLLVKQVVKAFENSKVWILHTFHYDLNQHKNLISMDNAEKALATSATIVGATLLTLSSSLLFLAFTLLFTFFILNYRRLLFSFLTNVFTDEHRERVTDIVREIQRIIKKYVVGLFLQMMIVSTLMIIVLSILGVKYAILLGLIAGIFNIIPYLGIFTALLISALITFATGGTTPALFVILAFVGVHTIDGNILMPLVVGSKVKINALMAFVGIVIGEMIWGISGMFLVIPYLAMLKIIFERVDGLQPWGALLGEEVKTIPRKRRTYRITKKIKIEEAE